MKQALLFASLLIAASLYAQNYTRSFRACFSTGRQNATRTPLQASATDSVNNLYIAGYVNLYPDNVNDFIHLRKYDPKGERIVESARIL